jgi:hypothetical protein
MQSGQLSIEQRMQIFRDVVELQDQDVGAVLARQQVARRHGVGEGDVKTIEREGIDQQWPPL